MKRSELYLALFTGIVSFIISLFFQAKGIYGGDSGDLSSAAVLFGIPHPSGYPLYTFLSWIATFLPIATVAWRVALLSSLPHAVTVVIIFLLTHRLTKSYLAALFASLLIAGNYVFFLYSVIPEVYALADLIVVAILFVVLVWREHPKDLRYGGMLAFLFGLGLSHHHGVIFLSAAIGLWWFIVRKQTTVLYLRWRVLFVYIFFGLLGLLPHVYIYFAAHSSSIINWLGSWSWDNFFRLFSLAAYGTFTSSAIYGQLPIQRWLGIKAFGQFLLSDFTLIGWFIAAVGCVFLYRKTRSFFLLLAISFAVLGPLWYFYGSFPLMNRFTIGTFEQFLSSPYMIFSICMGAGVAQMLVYFRMLLKKRRVSVLYSKIVIVLFVLVLFIYPMALGSITLWRFWGFANDRTGEHLGMDMLMSLPTNSILLLGQDTQLFTTQYERYGAKVRTDVAVLHAGRIGSPEYYTIMSQNFPQLLLPSNPETDGINGFIKTNRDKFPIFTNRTLPIEADWFWVPQGLVYKLVTQKDLPLLAVLKKENDAVWQSLHDPTSGILSHYNHLFLSDIRDVYSNARIDYGKILLRGSDMIGALSQFQAAVHYDGDTSLGEAYTYMGLTHLFLGNCSDANEALAAARRVSLAPDKTITLYEASVARDCQKNATRAAELLHDYESARQAEDTPLGSTQ